MALLLNQIDAQMQVLDAFREGFSLSEAQKLNALPGRQDVD